ncbi:hypothetical protein CASFOL_027356 [Castilleja foliolosa]|uniref:Exportin-7/Ran-binding protein 17 TPR repeats domain-containing protein n=1 Tax=Castilleja foliolosa TaxID=1961234 RepID=A0ABD3CEL1_9LAMI
MEEFSSYIQNHQYPHYYHHSHYPLHYNPNANYYEPYNFYESYEPEVYYDYYEPPSEQDITFSIQELNEQLKSMENQVNERFDKLERALGQIAEGVKELQQLQEMSEKLWTSPVALEVARSWSSKARLLFSFETPPGCQGLADHDNYHDSVYYLLGLWSRLVSSVPYLKGDAPCLLDEFVPKITEGFITSRLDSAQADLPDDISEHPLDNVDLLQDQLDCFPHLCRFQYEKSSLFIINNMEPILQTYMERAQLQTADKSELSIVEAKLAWIIHIIAAIIKIKQSVGCSAESQEVIDAELSARVLRLVNVADSGLHSQRYGELSKQRLDRAILTFFQNFRKSYVGDHAMHSSKQLYARLSDLIGLNDHLLLLDFFVRKIATNLKCYTESEEVIGQTLSLFLEIASGYMTGKLLLKLDTVKFIVAHHTREYFPFLEEYRCSRSRTTFYYTIGWLIFLEDSAALFKSSMDPLLQVFFTLESTPETMFRTDSVKYALIGLMRDLRGDWPI